MNKATSKPMRQATGLVAAFIAVLLLNASGINTEATGVA